MELRNPVYTKKGTTFTDVLFTMVLLVLIILFADAIIWPRKTQTVCVGSHDETQYVRVQTMTSDGIASVYKPIHIEVCDLSKEKDMP